jgi:hypothetical protein
VKSASNLVRTRLFVLLLLCGCDAVVEREVIEVRQETGSTYCTRASFCYRYGIGYNGKASYSYGFSTLCPGQQPADIEVTTYRVMRESGKSGIVADRRVLRTTGSCH